MAITKAELKTLISDTLQSDDETTFDAHLDDFIRQAEDMIIKSCQLPVMTKKATGNLVIGTATLTVPADYIAPLQFSVTDSNVKYQLKHKDSSFLDAAYPSTLSADRARPRYYGQGDNSTTIELRLAPAPDATYAYTLEYSSRPASLTAGGDDDTTWISTNMETALTYGALMFAAMYIIEPQQAEQYKALFMDAAGLTKQEQEGKARTDRRRREYQRPNVQEQ
ncbi:MAG: hypothetical protein B7Z37_23235 [Verrucomicrobia bacterium 12-59-8]|nr:MAG: hypothetical protein B7Z37_23235 [Verrucomicrobia bacterium 12-59-8]